MNSDQKYPEKCVFTTKNVQQGQMHSKQPAWKEMGGPLKKSMTNS